MDNIEYQPSNETVLTEQEVDSLKRDIYSLENRNKKLTIIVVFFAILSLFSSFIVLQPLILPNEFSNESYYSAPKNMPKFISEIDKSVFKIVCKNSSGSGWAVNLKGKNNVSYVVTNYHVIESCLDGTDIEVGNLEYGILIGNIYSAEGGIWESGSSLRDIALIEIKDSESIQALDVQEEAIQVGQWSMVFGYPSIGGNYTVNNHTSGTITGHDDSGIIITDTAINNGNSGGPLINSEGKVIGTAFATADTASFESIGFAQPIQYHCTVVFKCDEEKILKNNNSPIIYTSLKVGDCLGLSINNESNLVEVKCSSNKASMKVSSESVEGAAPNCEKAIYEIVEGRVKSYCYTEIK